MSRARRPAKASDRHNKTRFHPAGTSRRQKLARERAMNELLDSKRRSVEPLKPLDRSHGDWTKGSNA